MSRFRLVCATAGIVAAASVSTWVVAAEHQGSAADGAPGRESTSLTVPVDVRADALRRAVVWLDPSDAAAMAPPGALGNNDPLPCRFVRDEPSGTSAKFLCALNDGQIIKVKYGRNPEIQAEAAGTALLRALGFAADEVVIVPRVRCYGCPRFPFLTMQILSLAHATGALGEHGHKDGYTDFTWAGVERKFPAPAIKSDADGGWAWWELKSSEAPGADVDALRLLAVFLAHWDNKASNQRLVCLDQPAPASDGRCARPLLMIQDLGATFGPQKVNLARWRDLPVWADPRTCTVSMHPLPYLGATFTDVRISETGRQLLARRLALLDDAAVKRMLTAARFPEFYSGTDDAHDLAGWTAAFRHRVDQIVTAGPCPAAAPAAATTTATASPESLPSRPSPGSSSSS